MILNSFIWSKSLPDYSEFSASVMSQNACSSILRSGEIIFLSVRLLILLSVLVSVRLSLRDRIFIQAQAECFHTVLCSMSLYLLPRPPNNKRFENPYWHGDGYDVQPRTSEKRDFSDRLVHVLPEFFSQGIDHRKYSGNPENIGIHQLCFAKTADVIYPAFHPILPLAHGSKKFPVTLPHSLHSGAPHSLAP